MVVGTGNVNHSELVDLAEEHLADIQKSPNEETPIPNAERPIYSPALLFIRDDEMYNSNIGVFYDAPGMKHKDYYAFQLMQRIFGTYHIQKNAEHLNDVLKQYNALHTMIGDLPDVTRSRCYHLAYSDAGIFGNYFFGNEIFTRQMTYCGMCLPTIYAHYMNEVEVFRARNKIYNELLNESCLLGTAHDIASQVFFQGRRVPRSEIAA